MSDDEYVSVDIGSLIMKEIRPLPHSIRSIESFLFIMVDAMLLVYWLHIDTGRH